MSVSLAPALAVGAFAVSLIATRALIFLLTRLAVMDNPNHRSSHSIPTPRGGGWAIIGTVLLFWIGWLVWHDQISLATVAVPLIALALAFLSFLDDLKPLSAKVRLSAHAAAAILGLAALGGEGALSSFVPFWLDWPITILGWVWFINLFNFMDGIDGISGVETASISAGFILFGLMNSFGVDISVPALLIFSATLGFLVWNWHPARIFLGDVGSVPLGFLLGSMLVDLASSDIGDGHFLVAALLLPLYYLVDATCTLVQRWRRGARLTEAHREHFYQRAVQGGLSHAQVSTRILVCNVALIALAVWAVPISPPAALLAGSVVVWLTIRSMRPAPLDLRTSVGEAMEMLDVPSSADNGEAGSKPGSGDAS